MSTTCPPYSSNPKLLLIAPDILSLERAAQLHESRFCVTRADNPRDVYLMRDLFHFSVAVLSDTIGPFALRASAQIVRGQWPAARILILGKATDQLDDHLYDETVVHACIGNSFLNMLDELLDPPRSCRIDALTTWVDRMRTAPSLRQGLAVQESNPAKVPTTKADYARDFPASLKLRHRTH